MSQIISVHDARFSRPPEQTHGGREILPAIAGKPHAHLPQPAMGTILRQPGRLAGKVGNAFFEPLPENELVAWEGE